MSWAQFRAIAARLGLSSDRVAEVERGGVPTYIEDPLADDVRYLVRPDPDWTQRLSDAWTGTLVNSRRESAGIINIHDGLLLAGSTAAWEQRINATVPPGEYEVVVTVAWDGSEDEGSYSEHISHAWALLGDVEEVDLIEPMLADDGAELFSEFGGIVFTASGVVERLVAEYAQGNIWMLDHRLPIAWHDSGNDWKHWGRFSASGIGDALVSLRAGQGRDEYPAYRMVDRQGTTIGIMFDFYVDNRPH
jgi:hypothetical protein